MKKIITKACAVTNTLYRCPSPARNVLPGVDNSILISTLNAVPTIPANAPNIIYNVPMSLWFVLKTHRVRKLIILVLLFLFASQNKANHLFFSLIFCPLVCFANLWAGKIKSGKGKKQTFAKRTKQGRRGVKNG